MEVFIRRKVGEKWVNLLKGLNTRNKVNCYFLWLIKVSTTELAPPYLSFFRDRGFGKTHSKETKALISLARLGKNFLSELARDRMSKSTGTSLKVLDLKTNETSIYTSITRAAEAMGITRPPLGRRVKNSQGSFVVKKRYQVEKVENYEK